MKQRFFYIKSIYIICGRQDGKSIEGCWQTQKSEKASRVTHFSERTPFLEKVKTAVTTPHVTLKKRRCHVFYFVFTNVHLRSIIERSK